MSSPAIAAAATTSSAPTSSLPAASIDRQYRSVSSANALSVAPPLAHLGPRLLPGLRRLAQRRRHRLAVRLRGGLAGAREDLRGDGDHALVRAVEARGGRVDGERIAREQGGDERPEVEPRLLDGRQPREDARRVAALADPLQHLGAAQVGEHRAEQHVVGLQRAVRLPATERLRRLAGDLPRRLVLDSLHDRRAARRVRVERQQLQRLARARRRSRPSPARGRAPSPRACRASAAPRARTAPRRPSPSRAAGAAPPPACPWASPSGCRWPR